VHKIIIHHSLSVNINPLQLLEVLAEVNPSVVDWLGWGWGLGQSLFAILFTRNWEDAYSVMHNTLRRSGEAKNRVYFFHTFFTSHFSFLRFGITQVGQLERGASQETAVGARNEDYNNHTNLLHSAALSDRSTCIVVSDSEKETKEARWDNIGFSSSPCSQN
jgi:hypothetical protein